MKYTITVDTPITIISGHINPIFWFHNKTTGICIIDKVTAYSHNGDTAITIRRNVGTPTARQFVNVISGLVPIDCGVSVLASGFVAESWDGSSTAISGFTGIGDVVCASLASASAQPAPSHMHLGLVVRPQGTFSISAMNFNNVYSKVLMTVELTVDTLGGGLIIPEAPDIHEPA